MRSHQPLACQNQANLSNLPVEIILEIVSYVSPAKSCQDTSYLWDKTSLRDGIRDLKNLTVSTKKLYCILQPLLYARSEQDKWYALRWGAFHGSIQTMMHAINAGAPINYTYEDMEDYHTSNHCRCGRFEGGPVSSDNSQVCTLFHEKKPVRSAGTPLLTAIRGGQPEAVDWLLSNGADANYKTQTSLGLGGAYCRCCARPANSPGGHRSCIGNCGISPIQGALDYFTHSSFGGSLLTAERSRIKVLQSLVAHGADVNQIFCFIDSPHYDIHLRSLPQKHWNPLGLAVFTQTVGPEAVKFLLENGARFETGPGSLLMPVLAHMSYCKITELPWLVPIDLPLYECQSKARVLLSEKHPGHASCHCFPSYDSLNSLGDRESGPISWDDKVPYSGYRVKEVFDFVRELGLPILTSHLDPIRSRRTPSLMKAIRALNPEAVKLLLKHGEDPNQHCCLGIWSHHPAASQSVDGHNALTFSCSMWENKPTQPQIVLELLRGGANPILRNSRGYTALHELCRNNHNASTGKLLLEYGANPNALDNNGWTPLHHLCFPRNSGLCIRGRPAGALVRDMVSLAELLLSNGADVRARTRGSNREAGMAPCELALKNNLFFLADRFEEERLKYEVRPSSSMQANTEMSLIEGRSPTPGYTGAGYQCFWYDVDY